MKSDISLIYRVGAGKAIGLVIGLLGFFVLPLAMHDPSLILRIGVLLWYPTLGAIIGVFGVFAYHPVLKFPMPWWFRGALVGAWMNLMLTLIAYDQICTLIISIFGEYAEYASPWFMVLEGLLVGLLMDYLLTRWFGEGWADKTDSVRD